MTKLLKLSALPIITSLCLANIAQAQVYDSVNMTSTDSKTHRQFNKDFNLRSTYAKPLHFTSSKSDNIWFSCIENYQLINLQDDLNKLYFDKNNAEIRRIVNNLNMHNDSLTSQCLVFPAGTKITLKGKVSSHKYNYAYYNAEVIPPNFKKKMQVSVGVISNRHFPHDKSYTKIEDLLLDMYRRNQMLSAEMDANKSSPHMYDRVSYIMGSNYDFPYHFAFKHNRKYSFIACNTRDMMAHFLQDYQQSAVLNQDMQELNPAEIKRKYDINEIASQYRDEEQTCHIVPRYSRIFPFMRAIFPVNDSKKSFIGYVATIQSPKKHDKHKNINQFYIVGIDEGIKIKGSSSKEHYEPNIAIREAKMTDYIKYMRKYVLKMKHQKRKIDRLSIEQQLIED